MATGKPAATALLRALLDAGVQFVVVGDPATSPLRIVVSRHPTNLGALGRTLDDLGAAVRTTPSDEHVAPHRAAGVAPRRVGDPLGTVEVTTSAGEVDLLFGGVRRSLYADVVALSQTREVGGAVVAWVAALPVVEPAPPATSRTLARRLLSLAEGLARASEVDGDEPPEAESSDAGGGSDDGSEKRDAQAP